MAFLNNISDRITEWNYYLEEDDNYESIIGWLFDIVLFALMVFILAFLWLLYKTELPVVSILLAVSFSALIGYFHFRLKQKQLKSKRQEKWKKAANEYRTKDLLRLAPQQFKWTLAKALFRYGKFENIKVNKNHLKATFNNERVLIGFYQVPYARYVPAHELFRFSKIMQHWGYKTGFFFSTSAFDDACRMATKDTSGLTIHLIDTNGLIRIMDKAGIFKDQKDINEYLDKKIKEFKLQKKQNRKKIFFRPKNAKTYILYGVIFLAMGFVFSSYLIYYFLLALFFILLGILVYMVSSAHQQNSKNYDAEDQVL